MIWKSDSMKILKKMRKILTEELSAMLSKKFVTKDALREGCTLAVG